MFQFLIKAKNIFLSIFFPPVCLNCREYIGDENNLICGKCLSSIKLNTSLFCPVCRSRLAENKKICHFNTPYILAAAGDYNDPILRNLILCFKYKNFKNLSPVLGKIAVDYVNLLNPELKILKSGTIVAPIPLHSSRQRTRGFNQAELIASRLSDDFKLPLESPLGRTKKTKNQAHLKDNEERIENIKGCFKAKNIEKIAGKNIILVDDVFTSGATINEAVKILKENGAKKIIALVLAKA
ncbi:MAG: ComF family protein [Patescibacteria group bacterium]